MQKKKIAMLMSVIMILSGTAGPAEMTYAMDDTQISAETPEEVSDAEAQAEVSESDEAEAPVEEDGEFSDDEDSDESAQETEIQDEETDAKAQADVFSDEENAEVSVGKEPSGDPVESGSCGENATYRLYADGSLYIDGSGEIRNYFWNNSNITSVVIGEGISSLDWSYVFEGCKNLVSVTLPESMTDIGIGTFAYCSSLKNINLPSGLTTIGSGAFNGCSSLTSINLSEKITSIGANAFAGCGFTTINLPRDMTSIPDGLFSGCKNLTDFDFSRITSIGASAFRGCSGLTDVNLLNGLTSIGDHAFSGCGFKTIEVPRSLTEIGEYAFSECSNLRSAILPSNITKISNGMFSQCRRLDSVEIPVGVTEIGDSAFSSCNALTELTLPGDLKKIGDSAFSGTGITEFQLPGRLQSIGNHAFSGCSITELIIPDSVTIIGNSAFAESKLKSIIIPKSVTDLGSGAFWNCNKLETVTIWANISELKEETFKWCWSLKNVTLPGSLNKIGKNVFNGCYKLETLELPNGVSELDEYAFTQCGLKRIWLPENLTFIGYGAFSGCGNLTEINLPNNLESIDTKAFEGCRALKGLYVSGSDVSLANKSVGYDSSGNKVENLVLIGSAGSTTEAYAKKNGFTFHNVADKPTHVAAVAATCLNKGNVEYWHCETCGSNFSNEEGTSVSGQTETDIIAHNLTQVEEVYATCTEPGIRYHWHCNSCGKNFRYSDGTEKIEDIVIPARGHDWYFYEGYEATCNREGRKDYYHCARCGKNFLDEEGTQEATDQDLIIPVNNDHNLEFHKGHEATCREVGQKDYYRCNRCGKAFWDEEAKQEITNPNDVRIPQKEHKMTEIKAYLPIPTAVRSEDGKTHSINGIIEVRCETRCSVCGWSDVGYGIPYNISINADRATLKYGQSTTAIKVSGLNSDIELKKVTSGNKKIVTVSDVNNKKGTFKLTAGKKAGSTNVRIELSGGWTADVRITVQSGTVKTKYITGLPKSVSVKKGKTATLKPTLDPIGSQEKITYSSSNTKVATVSSKGVITGKKAGTAKITVKSGSKKATVTVTVPKVKTTKLSGVPASQTVKVGKTFTIKASISPKNSDEKITYKSSNGKIATVSDKGVVKGLKKGTVTITVQSGSKKQTCKVTVK